MIAALRLKVSEKVLITFMLSLVELQLVLPEHTWWWTRVVPAELEMVTSV